MAINYIEAAALFQDACNQQMIAGATSGWMEDNIDKKRIKYRGGAEVKIPTITTDGLGKYSRTNGYPRGKVELTYQTKTMTMDRGKQFLLDSADVEESGFIIEASSLMSDFQRDHVIPEVDSYRYSTIFQNVKNANSSGIKGYTPAASTILSKLKYDIASVQEQVGDDVPLVIIMPITISNIFDDSTQLQKHISTTDFTRGDVTTRIKSLDGEIPIMRVPSARMKTAYDYFDDESIGDKKNGFAPTADALQMNWIICPRSVPLAVSRTDKVKIVENPEDYDGWKVNYRKYHDLWILDKDISTIRICTEETT